MKKEEVLEHLRAAKSAHIKWVQKAKLLINGVEVKEDSIPVDSTECKFGQWFYSDGQILNSLSNNPLECMQSIEKLHFDLHDQYLKIFNIYFSEEKKGGFFAKLFGFKRKTISSTEHELAETYYHEMAEISKKLLDEINRLERRLIAIPEEKIEQLV
ncbi:MAG: CZB domain-containing protein [Sulfurimonas sp.]